MKNPGKMLREVLESLVSKPASIRYPAVTVTMPDKFRGKLDFCAEKCIGCKLCMRDCPTGAITIRKVGDKRFACDIDMAKCIYCAQCVDSCMKKALAITGEFELAQLNRDKLRVTWEACGTPALGRENEPKSTAEAAVPQTPQDAGPETNADPKNDPPPKA
jgi:formate hydrogenlyase subunit 6/NADH:ubiquinone oxidoreductase subunit I